MLYGKPDLLIRVNFDDDIYCIGALFESRDDWYTPMVLVFAQNVLVAAWGDVTRRRLLPVDEPLLAHPIPHYNRAMAENLLATGLNYVLNRMGESPDIVLSMMVASTINRERFLEMSRQPMHFIPPPPERQN